jgi:hypothetical protein
MTGWWGARMAACICGSPFVYSPSTITMPTKKVKRTTTTKVTTTKTAKVASTASKKNPLFVSTPKNFRKGGDIQVL